MEKNIHFDIKSFLSKTKKIEISKDKLIYDNLILDKNEIVELRHGVRWIKGFEFTIGRVYFIEIKNSSNKVFKIILRSVYGINKTEHYKQYGSIVNAIYNNYLLEIVNHLISDFNNGIVINYLNTMINHEGVCFNKKTTIPWNKLDVKLYYDYFSIYEINNEKKNRAYEFSHQWNAEVLYRLLITIINYYKSTSVVHLT